MQHTDVSGLSTSTKGRLASILTNPAIVTATDAPAANAEDSVRAQGGRATHLSCDQILDATRRCLAEEGYDGTTIRRIARELNCAVGSIYRYFRDKRALLQAVTQQMFKPVLDMLEQGDGFEVSLHQYVAIAKANAEPYQLMFWLAARGDETPVTGATGDAVGGEAAKGLPEIVDEIVTLWAHRLGGRDQATQVWATAHGLLVAGVTADGVEQVVVSLVQTTTATTQGRTTKLAGEIGGTDATESPDAADAQGTSDAGTPVGDRPASDSPVAQDSDATPAEAEADAVPPRLPSRGDGRRKPDAAPQFRMFSSVLSRHASIAAAKRETAEATAKTGHRDESPSAASSESAGVDEELDTAAASVASPSADDDARIVVDEVDSAADVEPVDGDTDSHESGESTTEDSDSSESTREDMTLL